MVVITVVVAVVIVVVAALFAQLDDFGDVESGRGRLQLDRLIDGRLEAGQIDDDVGVGDLCNLLR